MQHATTSNVPAGDVVNTMFNLLYAWQLACQQGYYGTSPHEIGTYGYVVVLIGQHDTITITSRFLPPQSQEISE